MGEEEDQEAERIRKELELLEKEEKLLKEKEQRLDYQEKLIEDKARPQAPARPTLNPTAAQPEKPPITTEPEKKEINIEEAELNPGSTYLITEEKPEQTLKLYKKYSGQDYTGLLLSRMNPQRLKDANPDIQGDMYWLTTVKSTDQPVLSGLQELSILVSNFIDANDKSVILLDGLEYLISNNDYGIVLRLIQQVRDKVSTSNAILVIPVNPEALSDKELTLLKRETSSIS